MPSAECRGSGSFIGSTLPRRAIIDDTVALAREANDIAKEANQHASTANWVAWASFALAAAALVISIWG